MLRVQHNFSLKPFNTFGMDVRAAAFVEIHSEQDLLSVRNEGSYRQGLFILGGGSNILLTKDIDSLVVYNQIKGIQKVKEDEHHVWLSVGAGEVWHDFVLYCLAQQLSGVENLSLIPGTVGASPMQNIGAYGVEVKDVIEEVRFFDLNRQGYRNLKARECHFDYRTSIFKQELKDQTMITAVVFRLNKRPSIKMEYGTVREELQTAGIHEPTIQDISNAIIRIRRSKLPDPKEIGNAGSFFKNPEVATSLYRQLKEKYSFIPGYPTKKEMMKIPAGWLIEQLGWKGYRKDDYGVHQKQALVLVNYGHATGREILELSEAIMDSVREKFSIDLEREVQII